jgi:hypothetical protein
MMRAGIYAGWIGFGNLGDEAMFDLCRERFPQVRWSSLSQLAYTPSAAHWLTRGSDSAFLLRSIREELLGQPRLRALASKAAHKVAGTLGKEVGILGGGTLINQAASNLESYVAVRKRTRSLVPVFGTGVASPEFWSSKPGWKDRRKNWAAVFAELPVVGVRGPQSMDLLADAGVRNVVVCGDPAIAYCSRYRKEISFARQDRPLRIAINTGDCSGNLWGNPETIQASLSGLVRWLVQENHHVEFMPVWHKDAAACSDLARVAGLPVSSVSPVLDSPAGFLEKIATFDVAVTLKLHAAVLASSANVPGVLLEYQPKCLDFAASLEWEPYTIRTNQLTSARLIERVSLLLDQLPAVKRTLYRNVGKLAQRFEEYCRTIEPMVLGMDPAGMDPAGMDPALEYQIASGNIKEQDRGRVRNYGEVASPEEALRP